MYHISVFAMRLTVKKLGDTYKLIYHKCGKSSHDFDLKFSTLYGDGEGNKTEKEASNLARAKSSIREYALCNDWEWFVTFTLDKSKQDRYDLEEWIKSFGYWVGNYNKAFHTKLKYLLIPEQHKDGAWHMHGLLSGVHANSVVLYDGKKYPTIPYYQNRFGYMSMSKIRDTKRIAGYITKYVSKDLDTTKVDMYKHMFYHSYGLKKAEVFYETNVREMPIEVWQNDFVGIEFADSDEALASLLSRLEEIS